MIKGNEPAMPVEVHYQDDGQIVGVQTGSTTGFLTGLTIRQHFAAMAMQGLYCAVHSSESAHEVACVAAGMEQNCHSEIADIEKYVAKWSVKAADALIAELNKPQQ